MKPILEPVFIGRNAKFACDFFAYRGANNAAHSSTQRMNDDERLKSVRKGGVSADEHRFLPKFHESETRLHEILFCRQSIWYIY